MMDHILKALNLELGFLYNQLDLAKKEIADIKKERDTAREQLKLTSARAEAAERECASLKAKPERSAPSIRVYTDEELRAAAQFEDALSVE